MMEARGDGSMRVCVSGNGAEGLKLVERGIHDIEWTRRYST